MPLLPKAEAKIKKGTLKAKVKYPLVGGAELELGASNMIKAIVKVPFLFKSKLVAFIKREKKR